MILEDSGPLSTGDKPPKNTVNPNAAFMDLPPFFLALMRSTQRNYYNSASSAERLLGAGHI